jgi:hypothetical protein
MSGDRVKSRLVRSSTDSGIDAHQVAVSVGPLVGETVYAVVIVAVLWYAIDEPLAQNLMALEIAHQGIQHFLRG